jgi:hypothetical protein
MLNPANLFRMLTEFIFILLGGFLLWLGLSGRLDPRNFNPRGPAWLGLGAVLIYWGARSWAKTARAARTSDRTAALVGGASLILVGLMMLSLAFVQFRWVGLVFAATGIILAVRGFLAAVLSLRTD